MAGEAWHDGVIYVDNAGGTPTEISATTTLFRLRGDRAIGTWTPVNGDWNNATEGGRNGQIDVTVAFDRDSASGYSLLRDWFFAGGARTVELYKPDTGVGSQKYSCEARIGTMDPLIASEGGNAELLTVNVTLTVDGPVTETVVT